MNVALVKDSGSSSSDYTQRCENELKHKLITAVSLSEPEIFFSPRPVTELDAAATKLQKVYKSYRTRRNLADCAVMVEELLWKLLEFAELKQSSISFFSYEKPETAVSRWARARIRAAKFGKGLSKNENAQLLALRHWLEAIDPRHRHGHNLRLYYDIWNENESSEPFLLLDILTKEIIGHGTRRRGLYYVDNLSSGRVNHMQHTVGNKERQIWLSHRRFGHPSFGLDIGHWTLDIGHGRDIKLEKCPRVVLQHQCIKYLGPKERESYEVVVEKGKLMYKENRKLVDTVEGSKWIFALSTTKSLYVGQKKKASFEHSSFLAGGATTMAGRLVAHAGILEAIFFHTVVIIYLQKRISRNLLGSSRRNVLISQMSNFKRCAIDGNQNFIEGFLCFFFPFPADEIVNKHFYCIRIVIIVI